MHDGFMNRRQFIKMAASATVLGGISSAVWRWCLPPVEDRRSGTDLASDTPKPMSAPASKVSEVVEETDTSYFQENENRDAYFSDRSDDPHADDSGLSAEELERYRQKMRCFDQAHEDDIYLEPEKAPLLESCLARFNRISETVGFGNFHLLGFDEAVKTAATVTSIGAFPREELNFLEYLFFRDASVYGFQGEKPVTQLTHVIHPHRIVKITDTGHFLYAGQPVELYQRIQKDIGEGVLLTSGIRSIVKQFHLFLKKACERGNNLSLASRSLAPPGYSFHGICDFDVGQVGYGALNFTAQFTETDVFRKLTQLRYVDLRYTQNNRVGVRFEPWHIKVDVCC